MQNLNLKNVSIVGPKGTSLEEGPFSHAYHVIDSCLCRMVPGDKEEAGPAQNLRSLNPPPNSGPSNFKPLSKVSEETSSLEKNSSGGETSVSGRFGKSIFTDSHGRQSTSQVLGGIHEQVHTSAVHLLLTNSFIQ